MFGRFHLKLFNVVDVAEFLLRVPLQQYSCRVIVLNGSTQKLLSNEHKTHS